MSDTIRPDELAAAINEALAEYSDVIDDVVEAATKKIAKEGAKKAQQEASEAGFGGSGEYIANWTYRTKAAKRKPAGTIYNKPPTYRLTHLLEYGHATVNGGRTRAFPHIKKAEEWAKTNYEREIREGIQ